MRDFYATMAQVLPVLLLALIWESRYLQELRGENRVTRRHDPVNGVRFWTKPRVRIYGFTATGAIVVATVLCFLVLAGVLHDGAWLRAAVMCGLAVALASLLFRICVELVKATR
ncbi:hypothetical protein GWI34_21790 [Actinomadura sp. DSM 109109]|nr:hypothetical protein [Actinomadura lepetitiana]